MRKFTLTAAVAATALGLAACAEAPNEEQSDMLEDRADAVDDMAEDAPTEAQEDAIEDRADEIDDTADEIDTVG
jgi:HAMP domain-containing protein